MDNIANNRQVFSPAQLHILQLMNYCRTDESIAELDKVISDYYADKLQSEADRLWEDGTLGADAIEEILNSHLRTPYK